MPKRTIVAVGALAGLVTLGAVATPQTQRQLRKAQKLLEKLSLVDGGGSGLDADLLDGQDAAAFAGAAHTHAAGEHTCPSDMAKVGPLCVDRYEASIWSNPDGSGIQFGLTGSDYPTSFPENGNWTTPLYAIAKAGVAPSTATWFQAQQACALSGKRLPTNAEWQMAAAGTPDGGPCVVTGSPRPTGTTGCESRWGMFDMVGNVPEWVADWIQGDTTPFAATPVFTANTPTYGGDFMVGVNPATFQGTGANFPAAVFRGGGSSTGGAGAGVFQLTAAAAPSATGSGFRCVE